MCAINLGALLLPFFVSSSPKSIVPCIVRLQLSLHLLQLQIRSTIRQCNSPLHLKFQFLRQRLRARHKPHCNKSFSLPSKLLDVALKSRAHPRHDRSIPWKRCLRPRKQLGNRSIQHLNCALCHFRNADFSLLFVVGRSLCIGECRTSFPHSLECFVIRALFNSNGGPLRNILGLIRMSCLFNHAFGRLGVAIQSSPQLLHAILQPRQFRLSGSALRVSYVSELPCNVGGQPGNLVSQRVDSLDCCS
mmetsp:Transcript_48318/g.105185  ORF Transcript_48318/g.105185 Transcript_48318/m.105185 type:complete len:247 (-) Transcript_48318:736-1476(-)